MAARSAPSVEFDGREYIMTEYEPDRLVRTGPVILISRREVEETVAALERRLAHNVGPAEKRRGYRARLRAYRTLLGEAGGASDDDDDGAGNGD